MKVDKKLGFNVYPESEEELCHNCGDAFQIGKEFKKYECPYCGAINKPCTKCDTNIAECLKCPLDYDNKETHWEFNKNGDNEPMTDQELENKKEQLK